MSTAVYLLVFVVCVVLSAFFSGAEIAFISLQKVRLEHLVSSRVKGADRVSRLVKQPAKLLSTLLLGNNFFNTLAAATATVLATSLLGEQRGVVVATAVVTVILLVFGDTTPKTLATQHPERLSLAFARPVEVFAWIFTPFIATISWIASAITRMIGGTPAPKSLVTEEEIRNLISVGRREGTVEHEAAEMLHHVFDFGSIPVRDVMVPRPEVVWVEESTSLADFLKLYAEAPLSRFPVYSGNRDNVVGVISVKDVLMALAKGSLDRASPIDNLVRPAYFAPETKPISKLFAEMRDNNYHLAVVVDEFGSTVGVVSLSQLIEEVVGPVGDELAGVEKDYEVIDEWTFQIGGGMRIEDVNKELGLALPDGDYETVAGFVLQRLGRIPREGDQVRHQDLKVTVTKMEGRRIDEVVLTREKHAASAT